MKRGTSFSAFTGTKLLVTGTLEEMLRVTKSYLDGRGSAQILIFDNRTGEQVDFNFQGTVDEVLARVARREQKKGRGRPRLGVVSREVSLLPRHWEWLDRQPNSASATLRRLVEAARKNGDNDAGSRQELEVAGKFMWAIAGNFEGFEEASRALYSRNWPQLRELTVSWPPDIRNHLLQMVGRLEAAQTG